MKLRRFLYHNTELVDNYLSALDGYSYDEEEQTENLEKTTSGGVDGGIPVFKGEGKISSTKNEEKKRSAKITPAAKFNKLYENIADSGMKYYESINVDIYGELFRDDIIEVLVKPRFSKTREIANAVGEFSELASIFEAFTDSELISPTQKQQFEGLAKLPQAMNKNTVSCVFNFDDDFCPLVAYLDEEFFTTTKSRFVGDVYMLCKIQRKIDKGNSVKVDDIFEGIQKLATNRAQRKKLKDVKMPQEFSDVVKGPAFIVIPIAVYQ